MKTPSRIFGIVYYSFMVLSREHFLTLLHTTTDLSNKNLSKKYFPLFLTAFLVHFLALCSSDKLMDWWCCNRLLCLDDSLTTNIFLVRHKTKAEEGKITEKAARRWNFILDNISLLSWYVMNNIKIFVNNGRWTILTCFSEVEFFSFFLNKKLFDVKVILIFWCLQH